MVFRAKENSGAKRLRSEEPLDGSGAEVGIQIADFLGHGLHVGGKGHQGFGELLSQNGLDFLEITEILFTGGAFPVANRGVDQAFNLGRETLGVRRSGSEFAGQAFQFIG